VLLLYSLWRYFTHLKTNQVYLIIAISGYGTLALARLVRLLWRSYLYGKGVCTAQVSNCEGALMVTIELKYVFITASGLSALSRLQRHPFSIAWWSENLPGHTNELSLLIQPRRGFTRQLLQHSLSHEDLKVWVDGPYGRHLTTDRFRTVILFASGMGIASHLSLIKEIIAQYYARCTSVTRLVLVWQVQHEGIYILKIRGLQLTRV
jgi:predicted ferric reductase